MAKDATATNLDKPSGSASLRKASYPTMTRKRTPKALDAQAASTLLNQPVATVRRLARRGSIPSFKAGKDLRFRKDALLRWLQSTSGQRAVPRRGQRKFAAPDTVAPKPGVGGARSFPIVGIGASAGGLEALESFLRHLGDKSGLGFVVVQHLDPTHKGMLVELLARATPMMVLQAKDRLQVQPDCVYVIPPNKDLSILHGVLHLQAPAAPRGLRLPIDFFLRSLAADQGPRAIGVILSGMGSDGTLGLAAIKEKGGAVFVQSPASAKFDAMPRSAIDAGLADEVAPAEELASKLTDYVSRAPRPTSPDQVLASKTESAIEKICALLRTQTGHDFSEYKRGTVYRRIERRMGLHHIDSIARYLRYMQESPQETTLLFKELLIGVTSFFRDPEAWDHLKKKALPALLAERPAGGVLRAWVPGCSTGEEAFSLAMVFEEVLAEVRPAQSYSLQIFATDLDKDSIDRARQGRYPTNIAGDVSAARLGRFFVKEPQGYRVRQEIRESVVFATQNLIMDPPFTKLDILSCRNLLIYVAPELQTKLLPVFHYSLNPGGILFLGSAETLGPIADRFAPKNSKTRIYRRLDAKPRTTPVEFPASFHIRPKVDKAAAITASLPNLQTQATQLLLDRYSPAAVLTSDQGDILYISGRTGKYLEPAAGKAHWNIHAMAREGLRDELGGAFQEALREPRSTRQARVRLKDGAHVQVVDVTVEPLGEPQALRGMVMIVFADVVALPADQASVEHRRHRATPDRVEAELRHARENIRSLREEMQTSQEELKAANEELQSTNEELQSTNEELTTSKEEMQSLNEELQTLNHELEAKVDDESRANDDMRNLLDSTDIATLFLDDTLRVRRFTPRMTKIIKLIPGDVNRPITDLASDLVYPKLTSDAQTVLRTLIFKETPVKTVDDRWFSVRIMPYRTLDNRVDGLVITFADITVAKTLEATLRENQSLAGAPRE
jgi:two-component system, chemotaxis family, CheB/CheR fusion protein